MWTCQGWAHHHHHPHGTTRAVNALLDGLLELELAQAQRESTLPTKTPLTYYGEAGCALLCCLTNQGGPDQLPAVYAAVAAAPSKMERQALQRALLETADALGHLQHVPVADSELTKLVTRLEFAHHNANNLDTGLHPFRTVPRTPKDLQALQETSGTTTKCSKAVGPPYWTW